MTLVIYCPNCEGVCGTDATEPPACQCDPCSTCDELAGIISQGAT